MGEVYRARDTKLGREVALKVLPEAFTSDSDRLDRFEREAKVLASLNHPHIAHIYGLEEADGQKALVLELVDGPTLADRIARGPIPLDEALPLAKQIAEALEAAHEQGIVHRDLKPANVKVKPDGTVKVLDFGLAKAYEGDPNSGASADLSQSPTLANTGTQAGVILGTAAYMSPEQARGKAVDRRADIWAFGCVLYEMLTGQRLFQREDVSLTLAAILTSDSELASLPGSMPPSIEVFLRRCLERDPKRRVQAMGDVRLALEGAFESRRHDSSSPISRRALFVPWLVAAGMAIVAGSVFVSSRRTAPEPSPRPARRFTIDTLAGTALPQGYGSALAISPDGETLAYVGQGQSGRRLYRRSLSSFEAEPIRGTDGAYMPFFSPDGEWVAFENSNMSEIWRVPLAGGEPFRVCRACVDGSWSDEGSIIFERGGSLYRVPEGGGEREVLVEPRPDRGITSVGRGILLPGGAAVLFDINVFGPGGVGVLPLDGRELQIITEDGNDPVYSPTGHILFARERSLFAVPFDVEHLAVTGPERPVLPGVRVENGGSVQAAVSQNGVLVFAPPGADVGTRLVWVDRNTGHVDRVLEEGRFFRVPRLSPGGERIVLEVNREGASDVWIRERGTLRPLTDTGDASSPIWTPDGRAVTFARRTAGSFVIQSLAIDGHGEARTILESDVPVAPEAWSRDGIRLLYREGLMMMPDLLVTDVREPGSRSAFAVSEEYEEHSATVSPSGDWVTYVSDQTGSREVYVRPFPGPGGERRISQGGGESPSWGADDTELVFLAGENMVAATLRLDRPEPLDRLQALFAVGPYWRRPAQVDYDVHPRDGRLLMLAQGDGGGTASRLNVIDGWFADLEGPAGARPR